MVVTGWDDGTIRSSIRVKWISLQTGLKISGNTILGNIYLKLDNYLSIFHGNESDIAKLTTELSQRNGHLSIKLGRP